MTRNPPPPGEQMPGSVQVATSAGNNRDVNYRTTRLGDKRSGVGDQCRRSGDGHS